MNAYGNDEQGEDEQGSESTMCNKLVQINNAQTLERAEVLIYGKSIRFLTGEDPSKQYFKPTFVDQLDDIRLAALHRNVRLQDTSTLTADTVYFVRAQDGAIMTVAKNGVTAPLALVMDWLDWAVGSSPKAGVQDEAPKRVNDTFTESKDPFMLVETPAGNTRNCRTSEYPVGQAEYEAERIAKITKGMCK